MEADVVILILLVAGFLLGILRGAVRQLLVVGAWLVIFVAAAYLRVLVGDFVAANAPDYSRDHVNMVGFLASFLILFILAAAFIEIQGATVHLTRRVAVDEILGGLLALGWMALAIAAVAIALDSYFLTNPPVGSAELELARELYTFFDRSAIIELMHDSLIPGLMSTVGLLLPEEIRAVYA